MKSQSLFHVVGLLFLSAASGLGQNAFQFRAAVPARLRTEALPTPLTFAPAVQAQPSAERPVLGQVAPFQIRLPPVNPPFIYPQPTSMGVDPSAGRLAESLSRVNPLQRPPETPIQLQRHPERNLAQDPQNMPFTLRTTAGGAIVVQASFGLQTAVWYNDNYTAVPNDRAIAETILEIRPVIRLNLGSPPGPRLEKSLETEWFAQLQYLPAIHVLAAAGTSRTLQRMIADVGRTNPIVSTAVHFQHDENIFGATGDNSREESYALTELSPILIYSPSARTSLRASGFYRRITQDNPTSNRTEHFVDTGIDLATSVKTSIGVGSELGHIDFDVSEFGVQNCQQGYLSFAWKPSPKVSFQTRAGVELREFERPLPKPDRVSPVVAAILNYAPDPVTRINLGLRVHNEPSVSQTGALFQEVRLGVDARRDLGWNLYARAEIALSWRSYDTKLEQCETTLRPAIGYHTDRGRIFDSVNIELFYQYRRLRSNAIDADYDRNIFGIETTIFF